MKKRSMFFLLAMLFTLTAYAQVPHFFNYQAVIRDPGTLMPLASEEISIKFTLYQDELGATEVYKEIHTSVPTGQLGIANVQVGNGDIVQLGNIEEVDWASGEVWMKTEIDPNNGFSFVSLETVRFTAMPYALVAQTALSNSSDPVGTVKLFWDAGGQLSIPDGWVVLDGSQVLDPESPLFGMTIPNMANKYAVGSTAAGVTASVGNPDHRVNLAHNHAVNNHTHSLPNHTHDPGSLKFSSFFIDYSQSVTIGSETFYTGALRGFNSSGGLQTALYNTSNYVNVDYDGAAVPYMHVNSQYSDETYYTANGTGTTASGGSGTSGGASPDTNTKLSSSQSIQPESIGFKYIMRIK